MEFHAVFFFRPLSKDNLQVADEVVVLLLLSDLSCGDAGKPSVHHLKLQHIMFLLIQNKTRGKVKNTYLLLVLFKFNICCMKYDTRTVKVGVVKWARRSPKVLETLVTLVCWQK